MATVYLNKTKANSYIKQAVKVTCIINQPYFSHVGDL